MDLGFTEEQQQLRELVRDLLAEHSTPEQVRALEDDPTGFSRDLWRALAELDLLGLAIPESYGGSEMTALETVVLYEEFGRALAATPHLVTGVLAAELLRAAGGDDQRRAWLPRIAAGEAIISLAWHEPCRSETPEGIQLEAKADGDGYRLEGTKIRVPCASAADALMTLARTGPGQVDLFVVPADAGGLTLQHTPTMAGEAEYEAAFAAVEVPASARLGAAGTGWETFEAAMNLTAVAVAAYAVGAAERALELAVSYAKEREQFGRPIGSFQGLAHPIADMATETVGAQVLVHQAAWALASRENTVVLPAMAKAYACDVFKRTTRVAQQVYGGMGFTRVVDIQLYFRRAKQLELSWFGPAVLSERIAAAELDAPEPFIAPGAAPSSVGR